MTKIEHDETVTINREIIANHLNVSIFYHILSSRGMIFKRIPGIGLIKNKKNTMPSVQPDELFDILENVDMSEKGCRMLLKQYGLPEDKVQVYVKMMKQIYASYKRDVEASFIPWMLPAATFVCLGSDVRFDGTIHIAEIYKGKHTVLNLNVAISCETETGGRHIAFESRIVFDDLNTYVRNMTQFLNNLWEEMAGNTPFSDLKVFDPDLSDKTMDLDTLLYLAGGEESRFRVL